jgi:hypothetical protein
MTYEAWRLTYQDPEQAARAAFTEVARLHALIEAYDTLHRAKLQRESAAQGAKQ